MNILQTLRDKTVELSEDKVCEALDVPKAILRQFISEKKSPSMKTCQKVIDLWANGSFAPIKKEEDDGSISTYEVDEHGCADMSYVPAEWGKKKKAWEGRDVCLCIPAYKDIPTPSFFAFMTLAMKYKMAMMLQFRDNDSMISRSRNQLAKRFLDSGATWSIWLDTDMLWPFGHAGIYATMTNMRSLPEKFLSVNTIERLISWGRTIVGGCYWDRRGAGKLIAATNPNQPLLLPIPSDTIHGMAFVGTGCLAVHRQVYLDIAEKFPDTLHPDSLGNECGFFTNIQTPQRMLGEDESFAKRATDAGHPSYIDLGIICAHIGQNVHGIPAKGSRV